MTSRFQGHSSTSEATTSDKGDNGFFECNICLEVAEEPVTTLCGHLFCWACLYKWMDLHSDCPQCPVCKAALDRDKIIPLYGRGKTSRDSRRQPEAESIPTRPAGQRTEPMPSPVHQSPFGLYGSPTGPFASAQLGNFTFSAGFGLFPSLFGLHFQTYGSPASGEPLTQEAAQQQFVSRLLLMLGSFVVLCLLLF